MKKIFILVAICCLEIQCFCEMYKFSLKLEPTVNAKEINESKYSTQEQIGFSTEKFELDFAHKIPSTRFIDEPDFSEWNYGAGFNYKGFSVFSGKLAFGGSISKLNSPAVSSSLFSLSTSDLYVSGISKNASLIQNCSKPYAVFSKFNQSFWNFKKFSISGFFNSEENFAFCISGDLFFNKRFSLSFSNITGSFLISNYNNNWFSFCDYFNERKFICIGNQLLFKSHFLNLKAALNFYENRNTEFDFTYSVESNLKFGVLIINSSLFSASSPYIFTSSTKNLKTLFQTKINPELSMYSLDGKYKFRLGLLYYYEEKSNSSGEINGITKISSDFEIKSRNFISTASVSSSDLNESKIKTSFSFGSFVFPFVKVSASYDFSLNKEKNSNKILKLGFNSRFPFCKLVFMNLKFELNHDNYEVKKASFLFGASYKKKNARNSINFSANIKIDF